MRDALCRRAGTTRVVPTIRRRARQSNGAAVSGRDDHFMWERPGSQRSSWTGRANGPRQA
jgi:hypothetical protein